MLKKRQLVKVRKVYVRSQMDWASVYFYRKQLGMGEDVLTAIMAAASHFSICEGLLGNDGAE